VPGQFLDLGEYAINFANGVGYTHRTSMRSRVAIPNRHSSNEVAWGDMTGASPVTTIYGTCIGSRLTMFSTIRGYVAGQERG
jgi:hypothetical protein